MTTKLTRQAPLLIAWLVAGGAVLTHGTAQAANSELANSESANLSVCIDTASDSAARDQKVAEAVAHRERRAARRRAFQRRRR